MASRKVAAISKVALAMFIASALCGVSHAGTPAETVAKWGLLGTWKTDCEAPPGPQNLVSIYAVRNGQLFFDRVVDDESYSDAVTGATARSDGTILLTIDFQRSQTISENLLARGKDGRIHMLQNRNVTENTFTVKNGVLVSNGQATPWMARCARAPGG